jgi:hypothetical protein
MSKIDINDFKIIENDDVMYIEWKEIKRVLGKERYKYFSKWMEGQTCLKAGAYKCDVENYLSKPQKRFWD